jgi:hypothetical protein
MVRSTFTQLGCTSGRQEVPDRLHVPPRRRHPMGRQPRRMGPQRRHSTLDHLRTVSNWASRFLITDCFSAPALGIAYAGISRRSPRVPTRGTIQPGTNTSRWTSTFLYSIFNVAIQGSFRFERRDYLGVYTDLLASLQGA